MKRRTREKILTDSKRILYEARNCETLKEVAENLNLTISQVKKSIECSGITEEVTNLLKISKASKKQKIEVFKKSKNDGDRKNKHYHGINTLGGVSFCDGKCILNIQSNEKVYIELVSNSYVYNDCLCELNIGDEVFVAKLTKGSLQINHYEVVNLDVKQNVRVCYTMKMNMERRNVEQKFDSEHVVFARDALNHFIKVRNL